MLLVKDYYAILQVAKDATPSEIRQAYYRLARIFHPDVYKGSDGDAKFKLINEAYQILSDPAKRKKYDFKLKFGSLLEYKRSAGYSSHPADRYRRRNVRYRKNTADEQKQQPKSRVYKSQTPGFDKGIFIFLYTLVSIYFTFAVIDFFVNIHFLGILTAIPLLGMMVFAHIAFSGDENKDI